MSINEILINNKEELIDKNNEQNLLINKLKNNLNEQEINEKDLSSKLKNEIIDINKK
jgi:hypothetical protein